MKKLYWKQTKIGWQIHILTAIIALLGMISVEMFKVKIKRPMYREKLKAAKIMERGMKKIKAYRLRYIGPIDTEVDHFESGMIGKLISPITSNTGVLDAKLATVNPNWAAAMVEFFRKAGVKKGDTIAAGFSGSFPSLNLATMAAAESMQLKVVAITSTAASTWGANLTKLSWLDMERILKDRSIISNRSVAASLGGTRDRGVGMSKKGRALLRKIIKRNNVELIDIKNETENMDRRMEIYQSGSDGAAVSAFVNVGGGTISVGAKIGKQLYKPGLNKRPPKRALKIDSIMSRFAREGTPIVHITNIRKLSAKFRIPFKFDKIPKPGEGELFSSYEYNKVLTVTVLSVIVLLLFLFIRMGFGYRIFSKSRNSGRIDPPTPMI